MAKRFWCFSIKLLPVKGGCGKDVKAVAGTTHKSISRTENAAGTDKIQRNDDETES